MKKISRREFLKSSLKLACGVGACALASPLRALSPLSSRVNAAESQMPGYKTPYYKDFGEKRVQCTLCPRICVVEDKNRGYCRVRENRDGVYYSLVYGHPVSYHVDPIEKKPFFHVLPGTPSFSLATPGCNFLCLFCQNWEMSQAKPEDIPSIPLMPKDVIKEALNAKCPTIAFTYTEPVVFYEYVYDTAKIRTVTDPKVVVVSNGFINKEPLKQLCSVASAIKIDLKAFTQTFYHKYCDGVLQPVLDSLITLAESKCWFEIVTLLLPGLNDSRDEIKQLSQWIFKNLGPHVPLHFSRFHPTYKLLNLPPTPPESILTAHQIAREVGLKYVYVGNFPGHEYESTYCHACGQRVIWRYGFVVRENLLKAGRCPKCDTPIPGVWT